MKTLMSILFVLALMAILPMESEGACQSSSSLAALTVQ
jgi:hypothetical protein